MYLSEKPRTLEMIMEVSPVPLNPVPISNPNPNSPIDEADVKSSTSCGAPKKRAETWVQDETRCLISLRRDMDSLFNTSKSNKHLWEQISARMREKGFERSPTMCTDKWRNFLKEHKKARPPLLSDRERNGSGGKVWGWTKEIEEILSERRRVALGQHQLQQHQPLKCSSIKVDSCMQFSDKGIEDAGLSFGPIKGDEISFPSFKNMLINRSMDNSFSSNSAKNASGQPSLNLETRLDPDGHPLAITAAEDVAANGVPPWNWRETPGNVDGQSYDGRVISVMWGDYTRRIGIDGSADSIKEAIKSAFRLRTKRAFWLEDEDQILRSIDREMPLGNYTLHLDEGLAIKVCLYDESDHLPVHAEDKIFYTEDDYYDFLARRGWTCLREFEGYRNTDNMDDLRPGAIYRGVS